MLIILVDGESMSTALIFANGIQFKTFINIEKTMFQKRTSVFISC